MTPTRVHSTRARRHTLPPSLAVVLLGVFLAVRGLVPPGFMPGSATGGSLYELCHGDSRSALLLNLALPSDGHRQQHTQSDSAGSHQHHSAHGQPHTSIGADAHQHDSATAQAFSDNHCSFSTAAASIIDSGAMPLGAIPGYSPLLPQLPWAAVQTQPYLRPPGRAPPAIVLSLT